jgi:hypothetical protein
MRARIAVGLVVCALLAFAYVAPGLRRRFIQDIITWDAPVSEPAQLPQGTGQGLAPAARVRVILIDGLSASTAATLRTWTSLCKRGVQLEVDVGFPTVSLPVEVSLWTGLTQQQTGVVFRSDRPLVPPLDRRGMPTRVLGSHAVAEDHGYIVRSLGFQIVEPASTEIAARDLEPDAWKTQWQAHALAAVTSETQLAFVHVLRVDTWGHRKGRASPEYTGAAMEADAILAQLVAAAPDARWFLLSDHGHLATGGHGGEDREVRQVQHCIVGPGVAPASGGPVHLVDVSHALADSLGLTLDPHSLGRPLSDALHTPLTDDQSIPPLSLGRGALAVLAFVLGLVAVGWSVRTWWVAPWWFVAACLLLLVVRGLPTMSMPMVYAKEDLSNFIELSGSFPFVELPRRMMMRSWFFALPLAAITTWFALGRMSLLRVLASQLALPFCAFAAALTACRGWGPLFGAETSPMVPHYTAFTLVLFLIVAQGSAAVSLALLARTVQQAFGRRPSAETKQTESSSG